MKNLLVKILILLLCLQVPVVAQVDFSASVNTGCDSLTVKFTNLTAPTASTVKWTFGDNTESTEENPQHTYTKPDEYLVTLKVNGTDSIGKAGFIKIGKTPKSDFTHRDTLEFGSHTIAFNPIQQSASPFPYSYSWSTSDGGTGNSSNFVHVFDTTGQYKTQLIISDNLGCADTIIKIIEVKNTLDVPNVFTPNDDNFNDLFIIEGDGKTTYTIRIFTRSGMKVFETSSKVLVWDGRMFSGEKVREGIYFYVIESADATSRLKQNGFFYIFR